MEASVPVEKKEKKEKKPLSDERKAKIKIYQQTYKNKNKEKSKEYMTNYVKSAVAVECFCGGSFRNYSKYKHVKTQKHIDFVANTERRLKEEAVATPAFSPAVVEEVKPIDLDLVNVEQLGSLIKLTPKEVKPKKEKKQKKEKITIEETAPKVEEVASMKEYVVAVASALGDKRPRVKKDKVVKISSTPATEIHNVVA